MKDILTLGVDIGSSASKCVLLRNGKEIVANEIISVGAGTSGPARVMAKTFEKAGVNAESIDSICATGYGRFSLKEANKEVSELSCHAKGAAFLFAGVRTVIDIGGQDVKALELDEQGRLHNFVMNDKCAAGTGRFLDVMARVLEVDIADLAHLGSQSEKSVSISSTCTVFAESEVISLLAKGEAIPDVINGIHKSVAGRVAGLAKRVGVRPLLVMTGGVAQNSEVVRYVSEALTTPIDTSPMSQFNGALGAAIYAFEAASQAK